MALGITVKKDLRRLEFLKRLSKTPQWRSIRRAVGNLLVGRIQKNFRVGGRPRRWKPKVTGEPSYLHKTGRLRASVTAQYPGKYLIRIGSNVKYGAIHHFGGVIKARRKPYLVFKVGDQWVMKKKVKIPRRPWLVLTKEDTKDASKGLWEQIEKAMSAIGE